MKTCVRHQNAYRILVFRTDIQRTVTQLSRIVIPAVVVPNRLKIALSPADDLRIFFLVDASGKSSMVNGNICVQRLREQLFRLLDPVPELIQLLDACRIDRTAENNRPQLLPAWIFLPDSFQCRAYVAQVVVHPNTAVNGLHQRL